MLRVVRQKQQYIYRRHRQTRFLAKRKHRPSVSVHKLLCSAEHMRRRYPRPFLFGIRSACLFRDILLRAAARFIRFFRRLFGFKRCVFHPLCRVLCVMHLFSRVPCRFFVFAHRFVRFYNRVFGGNPRFILIQIRLFGIKRRLIPFFGTSIFFLHRISSNLEYFNFKQFNFIISLSQSQRTPRKNILSLLCQATFL